MCQIAPTRTLTIDNKRKYESVFVFFPPKPQPDFRVMSEDKKVLLWNNSVIKSYHVPVHPKVYKHTFENISPTSQHRQSSLHFNDLSRSRRWSILHLRVLFFVDFSRSRAIIREKWLHEHILRCWGPCGWMKWRNGCDAMGIELVFVNVRYRHFQVPSRAVEHQWKFLSAFMMLSTRVRVNVEMFMSC